jgi:hypothetical protein
MVYTLILWGFLWGFASHETQGTGGVTSVTISYDTKEQCEAALKTAQIAGKLGVDPFAQYQVVGQCIAHPKH